MSELDWLDDGYPGCHRPQRGRGWRKAGRFMACMASLVRWAVAQPAKSAVATAALGLIVGAAARTVLVRHSAPNEAGASVNPGVGMRPAEPRAITPPPSEGNEQRRRATPDISVPFEARHNPPQLKGAIDPDESYPSGDLIDDRGNSIRQN